MGAFCAMLRPPFFGSLTVGLAPDLLTLRMAYDAAVILLGCVLAALSLWRVRRRAVRLRAPDSLVPFAAAGMLAVAGVLAINAGRILEVTAEGFYVASIIALCVGIASLALGWFCVLMQLPRDTVAALVMGAFVVSHVFGIADLLPRDWASVLSALYPLLALVMLCLWPQHEAAESPDGAGAPLLQNDYLRKVQICTMVLVFAEVLCGAFLRSRWAHGGVGYTPRPATVYSYLVSVCIGLVFWYIARRTRTTAECTLAIGSIGLVGFVTATVLFAFAPPRLLAPFVTGLYSALVVYSMALIALWGTDGRHTALACAATFLEMFGLASGVTSSIVPAVLAYLHLTPAEFLVPVGVAAGLLVSLGMCSVLFAMAIVHREAFLDKLSRSEETGAGEGALRDKEEPPSSIERHERVMDLIAAEYGLTERERETASLMARGYTAGRVAEELVVAASTVKGYSKSIYRKMGIHRKDELIETVNEAKRSI